MAPGLAPVCTSSSYEHGTNTWPVIELERMVDDKAQQQVLLFIDTYWWTDGRTFVIGILTNLIKNWPFIKNPSAFVATSVIRVRHEREPKYDSR